MNDQTDLFSAVGAHDPGGKVAIRLATGVAGEAVFGGPNDCYRYRLSRIWAPGRVALVVMMNPSVADPRQDDPTVFKVTKMARRWLDGTIGTLLVGNVFAYRATDQAQLAMVADPVGPDNDRHLMAMARAASLVVFAYGTPKVLRLRTRGPQVARVMVDAGIQPHVLRLGASGPWHPLYLPDATDPVPWLI